MLDVIVTEMPADAFENMQQIGRNARSITSRTVAFRKLDQGTIEKCGGFTLGIFEREVSTRAVRRFGVSGRRFTSSTGPIETFLAPAGLPRELSALA